MKKGAVLVALAATVIAPPALADDKAVCLDAYEKAQRVRQESKLRESKKQLGLCARDACPAAIRKDCGRWLDETEASIPTVIFSAKDSKGDDLKDVTVAMNGEVLVTSLTGTALEIDPGDHEFVFTPAGKKSESVRLIVREGEKRKVIAMPVHVETIGWAPKPSTEPEQPRTTATERPVPILTYVLGGVGLVSLGGFGFFALRGSSTRSDLDSCKPFCPQDEIDSSKQNYVIGDVFLGVSVVALAAAVVIYVTRPERSVQTARVGALR